MYACLAEWSGSLCNTAITQKINFENKLFPPLELGIESSTYRSRVRLTTTKLYPRPCEETRETRSMICKGIRQSNYAPLYINSSEYKESAMCRLLKNKMYRTVKRHDVVLSLNTEGTTPINDSTECPTKRLNNYAAPLKRKPMFCAVFTWTTKLCALLRDKDVDKQLRRYVYCPSKRQKNTYTSP